MSLAYAARRLIQMVPVVVGMTMIVFLMIHLVPGDPARVRRVLERWYAARARTQFRKRLGVCLGTAVGRSVDPPKLQIRRMTKRWGSCGPSGTLTLNLDLIRAPRPCIDYVIVHELCHLKHPNHSQEFYRLLSTAMPDWQERKMRLERMLA